jgi:hypothetical protein
MKIHALIILTVAACFSAFAQAPVGNGRLQDIISSGRPRTAESTLDASAKRALVEKAIKLKRGDKYQSVTNALGTPSLEIATGQSSRAERLPEIIFSGSLFFAIEVLYTPACIAAGSLWPSVVCCSLPRPS